MPLNSNEPSKSSPCTSSPYFTSSISPRNSESQSYEINSARLDRQKYSTSHTSITTLCSPARAAYTKELIWWLPPNSCLTWANCSPYLISWEFKNHTNKIQQLRSLLHRKISAGNSSRRTLFHLILIRHCNQNWGERNQPKLNVSAITIYATEIVNGDFTAWKWGGHQAREREGNCCYSKESNVEASLLS